MTDAEECCCKKYVRTDMKYSQSVVYNIEHKATNEEYTPPAKAVTLFFP